MAQTIPANTNCHLEVLGLYFDVCWCWCLCKICCIGINCWVLVSIQYPRPKSDLWVSKEKFGFDGLMYVDVLVSDPWVLECI